MATPLDASSQPMMAAESVTPTKRQRREARRKWRNSMRAALVKEPRPGSLIAEAERFASDARVCVLNEAPEVRRWRALLPVQQMAERGQIDRHQLRAALTMRGDWESAGFKPRVTARWGETPGGGALVPEERYSRYRWCVIRLPAVDWEIVQEVVLLDRSLFAMAGRNAHGRAKLLTALRVALDLLASLQRDWAREVEDRLTR